MKESRKPRKFKFHSIEIAPFHAKGRAIEELAPLWWADGGEFSYLGTSMVWAESGRAEYLFRVSKLRASDMIFVVHASGFLSGWEMAGNIKEFMISLNELFSDIVALKHQLIMAIHPGGIGIEIPKLPLESWDGLFDKCDVISCKYFENDPNQMDPDERGSGDDDEIIDERRMGYKSMNYLFIGRDY